MACRIKLEPGEAYSDVLKEGLPVNLQNYVGILLKERDEIKPHRMIGNIGIYWRKDLVVWLKMYDLESLLVDFRRKYNRNKKSSMDKKAGKRTDLISLKSFGGDVEKLVRMRGYDTNFPKPIRQQGVTLLYAVGDLLAYVEKNGGMKSFKPMHKEKPNEPMDFVLERCVEFERIRQLPVRQAHQAFAVARGVNV